MVDINNLTLLKDNKKFNLKRITPDEWKKISSQNKMNYTINKKEELSKWNLHFQENTVKLWDVPGIRIKWSKVNSQHKEGRAFSPEPKMRMFLFIDSDKLNMNTLFENQNYKIKNIKPKIEPLIVNEEDSIISPKRTNVELLKRLMSMYSQKRPAYNQNKLNFSDDWTKDSTNLPFLHNKEGEQVSVPHPKSKFTMSFSPSPKKSRKFWKYTHEKRKKFFWWQSYWIWIKLWRVSVSIIEWVQINEIISFIIRSRAIMLQKEASAPIRREDFGPQAVRPVRPVRPFRQHSSSFISNISHLSVPTRRIVSALQREELLPKQSFYLERKPNWQ